MKQIHIWLKEHPEVEPQKVIEQTIFFLNRMEDNNLLNKVNFSRMDSFRNSLRSLSNISSKFSPSFRFGLPNKGCQRRSVTFDDRLTIYSIYD